MISPLIFYIDLLLPGIFWCCMICIPFLGKGRLKKSRVLMICSAGCTLHALSMYFIYINIINWEAWDFRFAAIHSLLMAAALPFLYRFFRTLLREAFEELPNGNIACLCVTPFLFYILEYASYISIASIDGLSASDIYTLRFLIMVIGLTLFYINARMVLGVTKFVRAEKDLFAQNTMLTQHNLMKTEFIQDMNHDLKSSLAVISTSIFNAADTLDFENDTADMRISLHNAQREVMRLSRMIDNAVKRTDIYGFNDEMEAFDPAGLLREGAETYRAVIERTGNRLITEIPNSLPLIYGNADMLLHVLSNLLTNANSHTRSGEINIKAWADNEIVTVKVQDNGAGIKPELFSDIFKRGISENGTGFGLSIVQNIIKTLEGDIMVESEYDKGTVISFTLPVIQILWEGMSDELSGLSAAGGG